MIYETFLTFAPFSGRVSPGFNPAALIPSEWSESLGRITSLFPAQVDLISAVQFMLYFSVGSLVLGGLGRMMLGKRSSLNCSLSAAIGILFIYVVTIVVYTFKPWDLQQFLSPLPFVTFTGDYLILFPVVGSKFPALCTEVLSLIILAFLVNLLDTFLPQGKHVISWYILRFLMVMAAMALHLVVNWAFRAFLPGVLVTYAPGILLFLLAFFMLSGLMNLLLGLAITMANPFMGAMYTFFFSNKVGKQLSKAVFTSMLLGVVLYLLEIFGYTIVCISAAALGAYIPLVIILLLLWYLIGHVL